MFVYVIVCNESLKLYVGQHGGTDLGKYLSKKFFDAHRYLEKRSHLYAAMRKYPRCSWSIYPLVSDIQTKAELDETERLLIYALKTQHPDVGYNICDGGEGHTGPLSAVTKAKMSAAQMGHPDRLTPEGRARIVAANRENKLGSTQSKATRIKMSQSHKNMCAAGFKTTSGMQGRKHSETTLIKMRESAKRRGISPETHQKMLAARAASGWNIGHPATCTPEGIAKMQATVTGKPWSPARRAAYEAKRLESRLPNP